MIRDISIEDKVRYYELGNQINENFNKVNNISKIIDNKFQTIKVYELENNILGFIEILDLNDEIDIINIIVDKNHRRKKIGSRLLDYVIKNNQDKKFILEVKISNEAAINLYKKFGFEIKGIRKGYYNGVDAITMVRELWKKMCTY